MKNILTTGVAMLAVAFFAVDAGARIIKPGSAVARPNTSFRAATANFAGAGTNSNADASDTDASGNGTQGTSAADLAAASASGSSSQSKAWTPDDAPDYAKQVLYYCNVERTKRGLKPLSLEEKCQNHAQKRSTVITKNFSHAGCFDGFSGFGRKGENIAAGYKSAQAVVNGWMHSPGHRANILSPGFQYLGVGRTGNYWVQIFGGR